MLENHQTSKDPDACGCAAGAGGCTGGGCGCGGVGGCGDSATGSPGPGSDRALSHGPEFQGDPRSAVLARALVHGEGPTWDYRAAIVSRALVHGGEFQGDYRGAFGDRAGLHGAEFEGDFRAALDESAGSIGRFDNGVSGGGRQGANAAMSSRVDYGYGLTCPLGYEDQGYWCTPWHDEGGGDTDLENANIDFINRVFRQINDNIDIVEDYFSAAGLSSGYQGSAGLFAYGDCVVAMLTGGRVTYSWLFQVVVQKLLVTEAIHGDFNAFTPLPGIVPWFEINWCRIRALSKAHDDTASDGDGAKACYTAELAGTIVHETCHVCGILNEETPALLSYYYRHKFAERFGYTDSNCCAETALSSYAAADYGDKNDVWAVVQYMGHDDSAGCQLTGCGHPT